MVTGQGGSSESGPVVVVDSREQQPYPFTPSVVRALPAGDYSVAGLEDRIAIERKSKADAYHSLGYERGRFEREVQRLAGYDYAAIVVESGLPDFRRPPPFSRLSPQSAVCSLLGWSVKYRIPVFFCGDRDHGYATTWHLLMKFVGYVEEGRLGGHVGDD
jgi:ERCC4-type nuclease